MLEIVYLAVDCLRGYENNSRVHSDEQVGKIAASISEFGFTKVMGNILRSQAQIHRLKYVRPI